MAAQLAAGKIAAAAMPEPFATSAAQKYGAVVLADLNQGATQSFPIQGYVATRSWVQHNPGTLKAFLAALEQGQQIADTSRSAVEQAMEGLNGPMNGQVPPIVAAVMALNIYPIGIDAARLQRVPDVMAAIRAAAHPVQHQPDDRPLNYTCVICHPKAPGPRGGEQTRHGSAGTRAAPRRSRPRPPRSALPRRTR